MRAGKACSGKGGKAGKQLMNTSQAELAPVSTCPHISALRKPPSPPHTSDCLKNALSPVLTSLIPRKESLCSFSGTNGSLLYFEPIPYPTLVVVQSVSHVRPFVTPRTGLQHARLLCHSPSPGLCSDSCPTYVAQLIGPWMSLWSMDGPVTRVWPIRQLIWDISNQS